RRTRQRFLERKQPQYRDGSRPMRFADGLAENIAEQGSMAVVVDDEDRENEGDLIMAAEMASAEAIAFVIRHTSGVVCVALPEERLSALRLPLMVAANSESMRTAFTVS